MDASMDSSPATNTLITGLQWAASLFNGLLFHESSGGSNFRVEKNYISHMQKMYRHNQISIEEYRKLLFKFKLEHRILNKAPFLMGFSIMMIATQVFKVATFKSFGKKPINN